MRKLDSDIHKAFYGHTGKMKRAEGGDIPMSNMSDNMPRYAEGGEMEKKRGGKIRRAEGGDIPMIVGNDAKKKGGRCTKKGRHAEGDSVKDQDDTKTEENEFRKGGSAKKKV